MKSVLLFLTKSVHLKGKGKGCFLKHVIQLVCVCVCVRGGGEGGAVKNYVPINNS